MARGRLGNPIDTIERLVRHEGNLAETVPDRALFAEERRGSASVGEIRDAARSVGELGFDRVRCGRALGSETCFDAPLGIGERDRRAGEDDVPRTELLREEVSFGKIMPRIVAATGLLRIEGKNTQKMKRLAYKAG